MYDDILYPVDGSDGAAAALDDVRHLAETHDATVHLLYVAAAPHATHGLGEDPSRVSGRGMVGNPEGDDVPMVGDRELSAELRRKAESFGEEVLEEAAAGLAGADARGTVRAGEPHQVILGYAEKNDIDIIVVGTRGRRGLRRYLLGSVAGRVLQAAEVPVLTVRATETDALGPDEIEG